MLTKLVSIFCVLSALGVATGWAQEKKLAIVVIEGEGAFNDIRRKAGRNPVVEVRDEDARPVPGAEVVFTLPENGPGGFFADGSRTFLTKTDALGRAGTVGLRPNSTEGRYDIRVTASAGGLSGAISISQSNTLAGGAVSTRAGASRKKKIIILSLIVGGAVGGIIAATHAGGSSGPVPTTLSAGTVTVGGPQ